MQALHQIHRLTCVRRRDEVGGSAVEYGVMISVIVIVVATMILFFGTKVSDLYANVF